MSNTNFIRLVFCLPFIVLGCSKDDSGSRELTQDAQKLVLNQSRGATQISGVGFYATTECDFTGGGAGANYAIAMTGDLEGCLYGFIDDFECSPSGTYREEGREYFVGTYKGEAGEFWTTYKFEGRYEGCAENGGALGAEIFGRCQHPLVEGSGTGVFEGVTGRVDFKDEVETGRFPYRGHFRW